MGLSMPLVEVDVEADGRFEALQLLDSVTQQQWHTPNPLVIRTPSQGLQRAFDEKPPLDPQQTYT